MHGNKRSQSPASAPAALAVPHWFISALQRPVSVIFQMAFTPAPYTTPSISGSRKILTLLHVYRRGYGWENANTQKPVLRLMCTGSVVDYQKSHKGRVG